MIKIRVKEVIILKMRMKEIENILLNRIVEIEFIKQLLITLKLNIDIFNYIPTIIKIIINYINKFIN